MSDSSQKSHPGPSHEKAPTPKLTQEQLQRVNDLISRIRLLIIEQSGDDPKLLFAVRRKVWKELSYWERSKPSLRKKLKAKKYRDQHGLCFTCSNKLEAEGRNAELDRTVAEKGYTDENTRLICHVCHRTGQEKSGFTG